MLWIEMAKKFVFFGKYGKEVEEKGSDYYYYYYILFNPQSCYDFFKPNDLFSFYKDQNSYNLNVS